jgi:hypothetical protein
LIQAIAEEDLRHLAVTDERARAFPDSLFEHIGGSIELCRRLRVETGAELLRDPFGHLLERLIHASKVNVEGWLCHPGKLRDSPRCQGAMSIPLDRFEDRLKQAMPCTFLVDLA